MVYVLNQDGQPIMPTVNHAKVRVLLKNGKAKVIHEDDGSLALKSYNTIVMRIVNGQPIRTWGGYSATTMRHINEFMQQNGFNNGSKKLWENMPVHE